MSNSIPIYNINDVSDLLGLQLVVTNKDSSGTEPPSVQNGSILNYTWKRNSTIIKSGSSDIFRYYTPVENDINQILSCEVTVISNNNLNITVKKISYIKIQGDVTPETDIVIETDVTPETDIVIETDVTPETDIVIETDIVVLFLNDVSIRRSDYPNSTGITIVDFNTDSDLIDLFVADANNPFSTSPITNFPENSLNYQWKRNGINIPGQTNQFYSLQPIDFNSTISCSVSVTFEENTIQKNTQSVFVGISVDEQGWTVLTPTENSRLIYIGDPNDENDGNDTEASNNQYNRSYYTINDPIIGPDPANPINPSAIKSYKTVSQARNAFRDIGYGIFNENELTIKGYPDWFLFKRGCDYRKHYISDPSGYSSTINTANALNTITIRITNYLDNLNFYSVNDIITKDSATNVAEDERFALKILEVSLNTNNNFTDIKGFLINHGKIDTMFTGNLFNLTKNETFDLPENSTITISYGATYPLLAPFRGHPVNASGFWGESDSAPAVVTAWGPLSSLDRPKFNNLWIQSHVNHVKVTSLSIENDIVPDEIYENFNTSNVTISNARSDNALDQYALQTMIYFNDKIFIGGRFLGFDFRSNLINCNHIAIYDPNTNTLSKTNDDNLRFTSIRKFIIYNNELYALGFQYNFYVGCLLKYNVSTNSWEYILGHSSNVGTGKRISWSLDIQIYNNKMYILTREICAGMDMCNLIVSDNGINFTQLNIENYIPSTKMEFHNNYCYLVNDSRYLYRIDLNTNICSKVTSDEIYFIETSDNPDTLENEEVRKTKIYFIKIIDNYLYMGGQFDTIGNTSGYNNFAKLDLNTLEWSSMNFPSPDSTPIHLEVGFDNNFYIALTGTKFTINSNNIIRSYIRYNTTNNTYESITEPSNNCDDSLGFSSGNSAHDIRGIKHNRIIKYSYNGIQRLFTYNSNGLYNIKNGNEFTRIEGSYHHSNLKGLLLEDIYCKGNFIFAGNNDDIKIRRCVFSGSWNTVAHNQNIFVSGNDTSENTLFEECIFDMGGMKNNIYNSNYWTETNISLTKYVPLQSVYTRNIYATSFLTVRGCIFSRPSSLNFQLRTGGCVERNLFVFSDSMVNAGHGQTNPLSRTSAIIKSNVMLYDNPLSHAGAFGFSSIMNVPKKGICVFDDNIRTYALSTTNTYNNITIKGFPVYDNSTCGIGNLYSPTNPGEYGLIINNIMWNPLTITGTNELNYYGSNIDDPLYKDEEKHVENIILGKNIFVSLVGIRYCNSEHLRTFYTLAYWNKVTNSQNPTNNDTEISLIDPPPLTLPPNWKIGHNSDFKNYYCAINGTIPQEQDQLSSSNLITWNSTDKLFGLRSVKNIADNNKIATTLASANLNFTEWKSLGWDVFSEFYTNPESLMNDTGIIDADRDLVKYFTDQNSPGYDEEYANLYDLNINDPNHPENVEFDDYAIIKRTTDRKKYWEVVNDRFTDIVLGGGIVFQYNCSNFGGSEQDRSNYIESRAKIIARKFHAFLHLLKKAKQNRKGAWDNRYTSNSINDYIREGFGKSKFNDQSYDTRKVTTRFQEYIETYFNT